MIDEFLKPILLLIFLYGAAAAAEPLTLTGRWTGTWTDSRKEYSGSGGNFSGVCSELEAGKWDCTFSIAKGRDFKVVLSGKVGSDQIVFNHSVDLGKYQGVYTFKGKNKNGVFTVNDVTFTLTMKKQDIWAMVKSLGFTNETVSGEAINMPVTIKLNGMDYAGAKMLTYNAKQDNVGSAK